MNEIKISFFFLSFQFSSLPLPPPEKMGNDVTIPEEGTHQEVQNTIDLNKLCQDMRWEEVIDIANQSNSIQDKTIVAENAPLHTAISNNAPLDVVKSLVLNFPPFVAYKNKFGNTPLHFACWKNKNKDSLAIVDFLVSYYPQGVQIANHTDNYPLHWAVKFRAPIEIVHLLYLKNPNAVNQPNSKNETPLDLAKKRFGETHPAVAILTGQVGIVVPLSNIQTNTTTESLDTVEVWDEIQLENS